MTVKVRKITYWDENAWTLNIEWVEHLKQLDSFQIKWRDRKKDPKINSQTWKRTMQWILCNQTYMGLVECGIGAKFFLFLYYCSEIKLRISIFLFNAHQHSHGKYFNLAKLTAAKNTNAKRPKRFQMCNYWLCRYSCKNNS